MQTLIHPPTYRPAKFGFGQRSVSLPMSYSQSLYQCKDSLVLVIGAWWARCHEGADVKVWSCPLLHNPHFYQASSLWCNEANKISASLAFLCKLN